MNLEYAGKMPVYDLDFDVLIDLLINIPLSSSGLRHTSIQSSFDYIHPVPGHEREMEFIKDFARLGTADLIDRWYGGHDNAVRHVAELAEQRLQDSCRLTVGYPLPGDL